MMFVHPSRLSGEESGAMLFKRERMGQESLAPSPSERSFQVAMGDTRVQLANSGR